MAPDEGASNGWLWRHRAVLTIFGVALTVRVLFVAVMNSGAVLAPTSLSAPRLADDAYLYDALARSLAGGQGYQHEGSYVTPTSVPPLFPVFLAGLYLASGRPSAIVLVGFVNAVLGALTAILLYHLARLCSDNQTGEPSARDTGRCVSLATAAIFALYPFEIFNTPYVLKESFAIFLTGAFAVAWMCMLQPSRSIGWTVAAGALGGLSVLSRYSHLGLMFVFAAVNFWLAIRHRRAVAWKTVLALLVFLLVLTPWLMRNNEVLGRIALSNHGMARYLYNSNSNFAEPETGGYYEGRGLAGMGILLLDPARRHDVYAIELAYLRAVVRVIVSNPGHVLKLMGAKLVNMWRPVWAGSSARTWLALGVPYLLMMALALPGLVLARKADAFNYQGLLVLYALICFYVVGHVIFYAMIRERQYVEPFLIVFAGYSACRLWKRYSGHSSSQRGAPR